MGFFYAFGHYLSPNYLWLLLVVAALLVAYIVLQVRRTRYVARFSNVELLGSVAPRRPGWRRHLTFVLLLIGLIAVTLGVARPAKQVRVAQSRATVMLAIDVSPSMRATDVLPSRLAAARTAATSFVGLLPRTIDLGLAKFGGQATLLVSPTLNRPTVKKSITGLTKTVNSTAIGEAVFTSLQAIQVYNKQSTAAGQKPPPARIVVMSDGANTVGRSIDQAVAAAKQAKVSVSTIEFGTPNGTVDLEGRVQAVPTDPKDLRKLAAGTGGSFHEAATESELRDAYKNIGSQVGFTYKKHDISGRFTLTGLLILFAAGGAAMLWSGRLV